MYNIFLLLHVKDKYIVTLQFDVNMKISTWIFLEFGKEWINTHFSNILVTENVIHTKTTSFLLWLSYNYLSCIYNYKYNLAINIINSYILAINIIIIKVIMIYICRLFSRNIHRSDNTSKRCFTQTAVYVYINGLISSNKCNSFNKWNLSVRFYNVKRWFTTCDVSLWITHNFTMLPR